MGSPLWSSAASAVAALLLAAAHGAFSVPGEGGGVRHLPDHEAGGRYSHVSGSACCHRDADPRPISSPDACEWRCREREVCDAFVFAPSAGLCFLIRYQADSPREAVPATDRIFGLVREGPAASFETALPVAHRPAAAEVAPETEGSLHVA